MFSSSDNLLFVSFSPDNDSFFILFSNVHGFSPSYAAIVLVESPVSTLLPLGVDGLFSLYQPP